jgi:hypothetical protein
MSSFKPHKVPAPNPAELIEEIRIASGTEAVLTAFNEKKKVIHARGDYADLCLLRAEAKKHEWTVERSL